MSQDVIFRVDESISVGLGHMSRCRALADALLKRGSRVTLYCKDVRAETRALLREKGIAVITIESEDDFFKQELRNKIIILDGYQFNESYMNKINSLNPSSSVWIDDFRNIKYSSDFVICYNEGINEKQFDLNENTKLFLGNRYILLKPEISSAASRIKKQARSQSVMIASGGTQQEDWIVNMLNKIYSEKNKFPVWVLTGRRISIEKVLKRTGYERKEIRFFSNLNANQMISLYKKTKCLITPGSTLMLEAFSAGCPVVSGWIAENQKNSLEFYDRKGLIVNVGDLTSVGSKELKESCKKTFKLSDKIKNKQKKYIAQSIQGIDEIVNLIYKH